MKKQTLFIKKQILPYLLAVTIFLTGVLVPGIVSHGSEAGSDIPGSEAGADIPETEAGSDIPGAEAGADIPETEAGIDIPEAEAGVPEAEAAEGAAIPEENLYSRCPAGLDEETARWIDEAGKKLTQIAADREIMALVYLADQYPVRASASYEGDVVLTVLSGQQVDILDVCVDEEYEIWEYVRLEYNGQEYRGYIPRTYLAVSDSRFLEWEETYGLTQVSTYAVDERGAYPDIEQFPESYRQALYTLKQQHPNWTFVKMNTTLDWNDVIYHEMQGGKSLVHKSLPEWTKNGLYDSGNWYYATEDALKVYMDPRNSLTENTIFQFEQLTYNAEYHTLEAIQKFLDSTFMKGDKPMPGMEKLTYAEAFWAIGKEQGREVSPFHLAARVLQEQGKGESPLISGTYPGYEGLYNYFNVGATGTTNEEVIVKGLTYAREHGWDSPYKAILGGADFVSANYIRAGQDTLYLQKFNVNPNGTHKPYTHQYMQNISAPTTEARSIKKLYAGANALDCTFVFKIPVYENMPARPCAEPGTQPDTFDITLALPSGYSDSRVWLDGVAHEGTVHEGTVTVIADNKEATTAVVYQYKETGAPAGMYVWSLSYSDGAYTATPEPELQDLLTYHGFSIRITGKSGIRCKTGISADLRSRLAAGSVNGYRLREYGTLVMNNANRELYPMIKGGAKVQSSMAYGINADGNFTDVVYETVEGRYRYTSVLVGIPATQYRTEFAFRGYIILEKDGRQITLYGPPMARSIYNLAEQILEKGIYEPGSDAYEFLQKLISDAQNG